MSDLRVGKAKGISWWETWEAEGREGGKRRGIVPADPGAFDPNGDFTMFEVLSLLHAVK